MHSLLEEYLAEVERNLAPLPSARRNDELRELREHLLYAVAASRQQGLSEDDAVRAALEQFGAPENIGSEVVSVWRRGERRESLRSFFGAAICMTVLSSLGITLISKVVNMKSEAYIHQSWLMSVGLFLSQALVMALAGGISGLTFPKRAVKGTAFVVVVMYAIILGPSLVRTALTAGSLREVLVAVFIVIFNVAIFGMPVVISAWAGSQWRGRHSRLVRS